MKTIYVNSVDNRSYGFSPKLWGGNCYPVAVDDDFVGGNGTFNPDSGEFIPDAHYMRTHDDDVYDAELQRQQLIDAAMQSISMIQLKIQASRKLTDSEQDKLNTTLDYIDAVTATDTSTAPDIEWPTLPVQE